MPEGRARKSFAPLGEAALAQDRDDFRHHREGDFRRADRADIQPHRAADTGQSGLVMAVRRQPLQPGSMGFPRAERTDIEGL